MPADSVQTANIHTIVLLFLRVLLGVPLRRSNLTTMHAHHHAGNEALLAAASAVFWPLIFCSLWRSLEHLGFHQRHHFRCLPLAYRP